MSSQRLILAQTNLQRGEQHLDQLLSKQGAEWREIVVGALARAVQAQVERCIGERHMTEIGKSGRGKEALALRHTQEALYLAGQSTMDEILSRVSGDTGEETIAWLQSTAKDIAQKTVDTWASNPHVHTPLAKTPAYHAYQSDLADAANATPRPHDHVPDLLREADSRFSSVKDGSYNVLRDSTFRAGTVADVPRVVESYRSALLTSQMLGELERKPGDMAETIRGRIAEFRKRMHKGVFIWDLVEQEMIDDLNGKSMDKKGFEYRIRLLETEAGKLAAWFTYLHNERDSGSGRIHRKKLKTVNDYFKRGVTGKMQFDDSTPMEQFTEHADHTQIFLDIRSQHPGAGKRIGALGYQEMLRDNHYLKQITAYRLYDLHVEPPLGLIRQTRESGILPAENDSSGDLFHKWGYRHVAFDYNKRKYESDNGEEKKWAKHWAKREDAAGVNRTMNMKWDVMVGMMDDVVPRATQLWRVDQIANGDTSHDYIENV